jgi:hypothetical protein
MPPLMPDIRASIISGGGDGRGRHHQACCFLLLALNER